jgi:hypothetical protein
MVKSLNKAVRVANVVVLEKLVHRVQNVYLVSFVLEVTTMLLRVMHVRKASIRVSKDKDLVFHVFPARTTINSSRPSVKSVQPIRLPMKHYKPRAKPVAMVKSLNKAVRVANVVVLEKLVHRVQNVYLVSIVLEVTTMLLRATHVRKASIRVSKDKDLVFHVFQASTATCLEPFSVHFVQTTP